MRKISGLRWWASSISIAYSSVYFGSYLFSCCFWSSRALLRYGEIQAAVSFSQVILRDQFARLCVDGIGGTLLFFSGNSWKMWINLI